MDNILVLGSALELWKIKGNLGKDAWFWSNMLCISFSDKTLLKITNARGEMYTNI